MIVLQSIVLGPVSGIIWEFVSNTNSQFYPRPVGIWNFERVGPGHLACKSSGWLWCWLQFEPLLLWDKAETRKSIKKSIRSFFLQPASCFYHCSLHSQDHSWLLMMGHSVITIYTWWEKAAENYFAGLTLMKWKSENERPNLWKADLTGTKAIFA